MSFIQSSQAAASTEGTETRSSMDSLFKKVRMNGTIIIILFLSLYQWRSASEDTTFTSLLSNESSVSTKSVTVDLTRERSVVKKMDIEGMAKVQMSDQNLPADGRTANSICAWVTDPMYRDAPHEQLVSIDPNGVGYFDDLVFTEGMKRFLKNKGHTGEKSTVKVTFYTVRTIVGVPPKCN